MLPEAATANLYLYLEVARFTLGIIAEDGSFTPERPANLQAFGTDLVAVTDEVSHPGAPMSDFYIYNGLVKQY